MERQTVRTAARLCLGPTVQRAIDLVNDYDPEYRDRIDNSPFVWRLVMDQLPFGMNAYPNAGMMTDLRRVTLTPRLFLLGGMAERLTSTPRARRIQDRALDAVTNYVFRKHESDPPSSIITTVIGEIGLAQSYPDLADNSKPATTEMLLRVHRLDQAIESARRAGASLPLVTKYVDPETAEWVARVRARRQRVLVDAARAERRPL
jgi:hypothetical protein